MNTAPCNCHTQTSKPSLNERPRYYARQLVTPDDLTLEQNYFRARLRRHNRYLHGWGVVCGADVVESTKPWKVIVKTGYVLGPYGDEIFIEADQCVDVRKRCVMPEPQDDDECMEAQPSSRDEDETAGWIAIRYVENKTRPIRVPLGGCGCEDNACEFSRLTDDYQLCVIDHCPDSHMNPPMPMLMGGRSADAMGDAPPQCPECETEPWVVLSAFTVDAAGKVELHECDCRRQAVSFSDYWWSCNMMEHNLPQPEITYAVDKPTPGGGAPGGGAATKTAATKTAATKMTAEKTAATKTAAMKTDDTKTSSPVT